jgi:hypothetical protein
VHLWSVLHAAIPMNITIAKTIAMVCAMARLHNFCIDQNDLVPLTIAPADAANLEVGGIVPMEQCWVLWMGTSISWITIPLAISDNECNVGKTLPFSLRQYSSNRLKRRV